MADDATNYGKWWVVNCAVGSIGPWLKANANYVNKDSIVGFTYDATNDKIIMLVQAFSTSMVADG